MVVHRLRRWPNINPTLAKRLEFAGISAHVAHGLLIVAKDNLAWALRPQIILFIGRGTPMINPCRDQR